MSSNVIARNSLWYGVETGINLLLTLFTSIAIARSLGPAHLGYFLFVWWLVNTASSIGSLGIPTATRKYMGEYFGRGEMGAVRSIFYSTLKLQSQIAIVLTLLAIIVAWTSGDPAYRTASLLMVISILPCMVNAIAAQANAALEDLSANVPGSLVSTAIFVIGVTVSITFGWDLLGISVALLVMRSAELLVRVVPLFRKMRRFPRQTLPAALRTRMFHFSGQSMILMVLGLVVWDRSELFFLKALCADIRQVAFYSVAFNVTERLLVFSQVFGNATGTTMMVQYGRDEKKLGPMMALSFRYLGLISFPIHCGLAAIAGPVMLMAYGAQYAPAVPALVIAAIFGIPKAFMVPISSLLQSYEKQTILIRWGLICAVISICLDVLMIPKYGAIGASIANGMTQTVSAVGLVWAVWHHFAIQVQLRFLTKCFTISGCMAIMVCLAVRQLPSLQAAVAGVVVGTGAYCAILRLTRLLDSEDHRRLAQLGGKLPGWFAGYFDSGLGFLIPSARLGK